MTKERLKELVDKLESITNGGENLLTQDDYGDVYTMVFEAYEAKAQPMVFEAYEAKAQPSDFS